MLCYRCHHLWVLKPSSHLEEFRRASERGWQGAREHLARSRLKLKPYNTRFAPPTNRLSKCDRICDSGIAFSRGTSPRRKKAAESSRACRGESDSRRRHAEQTDNIRSSRDSLKTASGERSLSRFCRRLIRPSILSARCA